MAEKILKEFKRDISAFVLIPSDGGRFEVSVEGDLIFSKMEQGRFPEYKELQPAIEKRLAAS